MNTFLKQSEATFYHVTTIKKWRIIEKDGLISNQNRIFVSRVGEFPVLLAIALEQLPEIYETEKIVFLKLPQNRNNFNASEIIRDNQAGVEWTQPYQNIIFRAKIPSENIELMSIINLGKDAMERTLRINCLTQIANSGQINYKNHFILSRANELKY